MILPLASYSGITDYCAVVHEAHCLNDPDSSSATAFERILPIFVPALGLPAIPAI